MSIAQKQNAWRLAGSSVVVLLLLTLMLYQHTVLYLAGLWNQLVIGEYAHGYLVLAISVYLVWESRQRLLVVVPSPQYWLVIAVSASSLLWLVSALVDVEMMQAVALWLLVLALVWTVLGNRAIRILAFPILFIGFAIPVWFPLSPILQNLTADGVFWVIRLLSVPALRQDNMIVLPAGTLSIEEACSGLRYLLAALTLGTLYAYMNYTSLRARLVVVLISAGSAILANMVRVFIVVYLGYTTEMQHPLINEHLSFGWYIFAGMVATLLFIDAGLHRFRSVVSSRGLDETLEVITPLVSRRSPLYYFMFIVGGGLLLSVAPAILYQLNHQPASDAVKVVPELPLEGGDWLRTVASDDAWMPVYNGAINLKQFYKKDDNEVVLYMGYYAVQSQGKELINDLNRISNKEVWSTIYPRARLHSAGDGQVLEQMISNDMNKKRLVWYWYNIAGKVTINKYEAKLLQVLGILTGKPWAFVVAVTSQIESDADSSRQVLKDFVFSIDKPMKKEMERALTLQHKKH